jgi:hypothetical protein
MAIMMTIGLIGACMIRQINNHNIWARYMGYCLLSAYTSTFPLALSLNTANYGGFTKKTTVNAMVCITRYTKQASCISGTPSDSLD